MPYFRRRFRYRVRRPWRVRRLYRRRSYGRRYVNASSRSSLRMKCNQVYTGQVNAGFTDAATNAVITGVSPYNADAAAVTTNALYRAYTQLYEETKLLGMKVALSVVSTVGGADIPSLQIYTTWDRRHGYGEANPTVAEILASSAQTVSTALNNNVAKITRSCYASDLMEKAQWHDCSGSNAAGTLGFDAAWVAAGTNPNFFCPGFFFFFNCPSKAAVTAISYSISVTYYVAFRNPKYGGSSSGAKDLPVKSVAFSGLDDGGDLDLDDRMMDVAAQAYPDLPPDEPGDFPEDSSLTPGAVVARANTSARREAEARLKRSTVVVPHPRVRDPKNA